MRDHGFEVSEHYNLDRADLLDALETFKRQAQDAEVALVYYAGHGMEIECARSRPRSRSVEIDALFAAQAQTPQKIVLLDACRNNPFPQCPTRGFGAGGGFREVGPFKAADNSVMPRRPRYRQIHTMTRP